MCSLPFRGMIVPVLSLLVFPATGTTTREEEKNYYLYKETFKHQECIWSQQIIFPLQQSIKNETMGRNENRLYCKYVIWKDIRKKEKKERKVKGIGGRVREMTGVQNVEKYWSLKNTTQGKKRKKRRLNYADKKGSTRTRFFLFVYIRVWFEYVRRREREIGFARVNRKKEKAKQITWDDIKI